MLNPKREMTLLALLQFATPHPKHSAKISRTQVAIKAKTQKYIWTPKLTNPSSLVRILPLTLYRIPPPPPSTAADLSAHATRVELVVTTSVPSANHEPPFTMEKASSATPKTGPSHP
jgi:hypothetical protein